MLREEAATGEELGALSPRTLKSDERRGRALPIELGGYALGARDYVEIVTALSEGDGSAGWTAFVAGGIRNVLGFPQETVDEVFKEADTVADMPSTHVAAGAARAMISVAEAAISRHAGEVDRRAQAGELFTPDEEAEITMDLVYAVKLRSEAIDKLQLTIGASTVSLKNPVQRFARDVRVLGHPRRDPLRSAGRTQRPLGPRARAVPDVRRRRAPGGPT